jgi:hypothetical protein
MPMRAIVIIKTGLRPMRSPREPKRAAPRGLTTIPTPKVAKLAKRPTFGSVAGKNNGASTTARVAKVRKSYHSKKVPKQAAIAIFRKWGGVLTPSISVMVFNLFRIRR